MSICILKYFCFFIFGQAWLLKTNQEKAEKETAPELPVPKPFPSIWLYPVLFYRIKSCWGLAEIDHDVLHLGIMLQHYLMGFTSNAGCLIAARCVEETGTGTGAKILCAAGAGQGGETAWIALWGGGDWRLRGVRCIRSWVEGGWGIRIRLWA